MGYYWPTMKKDTVEFVKKCHNYQVQANLIHTHPQNLHSLVTPWPFHTWGLDLVGPVNPPSRGYIWILVDECDGDPLRCLGPKEAKGMIKEVHSGEYGEYQGKKKLYKGLL